MPESASRGCLLLGDVCSRGVSGPRACLLLGGLVPGGVWYPSMHWSRHTPCEQNDRQVQKYYLGHNFVAAVKKHISPSERSHRLNTRSHANCPLANCMCFIPVQWGPSWTSLNICTCLCDRACARVGGLGPLQVVGTRATQGGRLLYSEIEYNVGNGHMGTLICEQNDRHDWKHYLPQLDGQSLIPLQWRKVKQILHGILLHRSDSNQTTDYIGNFVSLISGFLWKSLKIYMDQWEETFYIKH